MEPPYDLSHELALVRAQLRQIFPNYQEVVEMEIPMFFQGTWTAEMAHRLGQSGDQRLDPVSPIPNLYLVGYDCIGYGMAGDIIPHGVERVLHTHPGRPAVCAGGRKSLRPPGKMGQGAVVQAAGFQPTIEKMTENEREAVLLHRLHFHFRNVFIYPGAV